MTSAAPVPPALAAAVRAGEWAEVRALTAPLSRPLPSAVALVVARAAARTGAIAEALTLLRAALPAAGELTAALRLEGGEIALSRGESPWPWIGPLLRGSAPAAHRRAAADLLRRSWQTLPAALLRQQRALPLSRPLQRDLLAALAVRSDDLAAAARVLQGRHDDEAAVRVSCWLSQRGGVPPGLHLAAAQALLSGGWWHEAEAMLAGAEGSVPAHLRSSLEFVRGRAAYRCGDLSAAAQRFDVAFAAAATDADRFAAAVQRARVAELSGDRAAALPFWDLARSARPAEVEGWDGGARARAVLGRADEAVGLLLRAPAKAVRVAGPRLAALLLARGDLDRAAALLTRLPQRDPAVRALWVDLEQRRGKTTVAAAVAEQLLADPHGGAWRSLVLDLFPESPAGAGRVQPSRDARVLAELAVTQGAAAARAALTAELIADPRWHDLVTGAALPPPAMAGPAGDLAAVGLDREAAVLYAGGFPLSSPAELAWSAAHLSQWGNGPAGLSAAERLEDHLGDLPHEVIPDAVVKLILPPTLTADCAAAARAVGGRPTWLAAVVRIESRFDTRARSLAGAIGIAQLMPSTARRLGADPDELWSAGRALELAARELARLGQKFDNRLVVVAAAYNAGDEIVASWREALGGTTDDLLFAASIPYAETADYVLEVREGVALARYLE
jgi:soluble lytic murein transglycosylase-like protein